MSQFYTEVSQRGNTIFTRGFENGKRFQRKVQYSPYLFMSNKGASKSTYKTLMGEPVERIDFENIREAKNFTEQYKDVGGMSIYGFTNFIYPYLNDTYPGKVDFDLKLVRKVNIDIECAPEEGEDEGFPDIETANQHITAVTCSYLGKMYSFSCVPFKNNDPKVTHKQCRTEKELLLEFVVWWESVDPDVVTGWNIENFDIPYIMNRTLRVLGETSAKRLSPWKLLETQTIKVNGDKLETFKPLGVCVIDYLKLYKKFTYTQRENYKLDTIAFYELDERKLDHSEYANLTEFYRKNPQKYLEYNIHDVRIVDRLEEKLGLLALGLTLAYDAKITFNDMFTSIRLWDVIIHNYLLDQGIVVPLEKKFTKTEKFMGAYVQEPKVGKHKYVATFDVNSLYPSIIVQNNMSPETYIGNITIPTVEELLVGGLPEDIFDNLVSHNYSLSANGALWDNSTLGAFPALVMSMYKDRKDYQNQLKFYKEKYLETPTKEISDLISVYHNLQLVKKIVLNSLYGATGNPGFRYYQNDYAEGVTYSGKLAIKWVANDINKFVNKALKTSSIDYIVYSDTDSVFVSLGALVDKYVPEISGIQKMIDFVSKVCSENIEPVIERSFESLKEYMNSKVNNMKMKRENICDTAIFLAKKKYIMNVYDSDNFRYKEPSLYIKGVEAVRSSTPYACREKLKNSLKIIMSGTNKELINYIESFRQEFKTMPFEDVAFPRGCNGIEDYQSEGVTMFNTKIITYKKGTPIHVRGSIVYNNLLRKNKLDKTYPVIIDAEKVKFCYMKVPNTFRENIISCPGALPKELNIDRFVDYQTQFDKAFLSPIKNITNAIGWKTEERSTLASLLDYSE